MQLNAILPVAAIVDSAAGDRRNFLMRPDLGRRLTPSAEEALVPHHGNWDLAFVLADGLSAQAVVKHACPVLTAVLPMLRTSGWRIAPVTIVRQGRVAIGDAVAAVLGAGAVVVLIGERPGLSAQDSLSAYLTWRPRPGIMDSDRNCISNIRPSGMSYDQTAAVLVRLLKAMHHLGYSGVILKDNGPGHVLTDGPERHGQ